jgi:hypothetical protein
VECFGLAVVRDEREWSPSHARLRLGRLRALRRRWSGGWTEVGAKVNGSRGRKMEVSHEAVRRRRWETGPVIKANKVDVMRAETCGMLVRVFT